MHRNDSADNAERHDEHDGKRHRPAFVKCCKNKENDEERKRHQHGRLRTGLAFLQRLTGPLNRKALGQFGCEPFHFFHRLTAGYAQCGGAGNAGRGIAVIAGELQRHCRPLRRDDFRKANHLAGIVADVEVEHVIHLHAACGPGLHDHLLQASIAREIIDIGRTNGPAERIGDGRVGHAERARFLPVHVHGDARAAGKTIDADIGHELALRRKPGQLGRSLAERIRPVVGAVLQPQRKARCRAELIDCGRLEAEYLPLVGGRHRARRSADFVVHACLALAPFLERGEGHRRVRA